MRLSRQRLLIYLCCLRGAKFGKRVKFRGLALVERFQCSTIEIGDNCTFNSSSRFNFRGINHKCIVQIGKPGARIIIGKHCDFSGVSIVADREVVLEDYVTVGQMPSLATAMTTVKYMIPSHVLCVSVNMLGLE